MIYGSACSGIEAATVAWEPLGWKAAWFSEIESFPCAVLQHHYPDVPNLGDMTKLHEKEIFNDTNIDVLIGGTPCQSFSVAGLRKGMDDPRGNLALVFLGLIDRTRPSWVVWENVPGVLSSNRGRDFGAFLGALAELGYGFAYAILDAQHFGVPQRRRRVFVVGYLGDWRPATAVLFDRTSLSGDTPPSREKGERVAPTVTGGPPFSRTGNERVECEAMVFEVGPSGGKRSEVVPTLDARCKDGAIRNQIGPIVMAHGQGNAEIRKDGSPSLTCNHEAPIVAFHENAIGEVRTQDVAYTLGTTSNSSARQTPKLLKNSTVRRLTPTECERLQGFPDGYTNIPWRGKSKSPDSPRYKALGNSMAVPVIRWIGERIEAVKNGL